MLEAQSSGLFVVFGTQSCRPDATQVPRHQLAACPLGVDLKQVRLAATIWGTCKLSRPLGAQGSALSIARALCPVAWSGLSVMGSERAA